MHSKRKYMYEVLSQTSTAAGTAACTAASTKAKIDTVFYSLNFRA